MIDSHGGYEQLDFEFGDGTEAYGSCSLQWHNHFYVFGGDKESRQVSMVNGNKLERKATLDFNFHKGACTALNQITIVLCFDYYERKVCRQSNNPYGSFITLPNSNYQHYYIRIASFDGEKTLLKTVY